MIGLDFSTTGEWLRGTGPDADVVVSTRVRLARNLAGFAFTNRADRAEKRQLVAMAREHVMPLRDDRSLLWIDLTQLDDLDGSLLVERHLISKQLAKGDDPRAAIVSNDEALSIMVNEEDHLRIQVIRSGRQLRSAFDEIGRLDDRIGERLPYAYHKRFGFLTACPTNVGTGIRLSVMLHLPALMLTKEIDRVRRAARDMQLAVRGFYGEGSDVLGDFFQISNQTTLGKSEDKLLSDFDEAILPHVIEYERQARRLLVEKRQAQLDDRVFRALGTLRSARIMKLDEALRLLSHLRLGVQLGRVKDVDVAAVDRLMLLVQSAHLQKTVGQELHQAQRGEVRAAVVRQHLGG